MLDFTVSAADLGKPAGADLKLGLATAPVLFAWEEFPELEPLIKRKFSQEGDVEKVWRVQQRCRIASVIWTNRNKTGTVISIPKWRSKTNTCISWKALQRSNRRHHAIATLRRAVGACTIDTKATH